MFITNPEVLTETFICGKKLAEYLINKYKIALLSQKKTQYYFSKTQELNEILDNLPFLVKLFYK